MAKHTPLVSILIPCYNYGQYIEKCIQSTLDQTYENIEVIVVDNGSTDDSLEKINLFSNNKKIKIIKIKENIPPVTDGVSAIGIAIEESKGSYISILYADDWYLPEKIEKQVSLFNIMPNSVGVVYCHGYYYIEESKTKVEHKRQSVRGYVFKDYLTKGDIAMPISPLVKRYCYDIIGFDNIWTGSEYDFLLMSQYVDFDFVDEYLVVMRMHNNNFSKDILFSYNMVRRFHSSALLNPNTILRGGRTLINKRMARDFISFGLGLIVIMDKNNGRLALMRAIRIYPIFIFKPKVLMSLLLSFLPMPVLRYVLVVIGVSKSPKEHIY